MVDITTGIANLHQFAKNGMAQGYQEDKTISLPFTLPGETVAFECHSFRKYKKFFPREVINASPERIEPKCKHFTQCGGCMLQHMSHNLYHDFKMMLLRDPLIQEGLDPFVVDGLTILPFGKRRRANMDVVRKQDTLFLGFHRYQSHQVINIEECFTLEPPIVAILPDLRQALFDILLPFQKAKVFFTHTSIGTDVSLEIQGIATLTHLQRDILHHFAQKHQLARFVFKYRKTIDTLYVIAQPTVEFSGIQVEVDAYSFLQATNEADEFMAKFILKHVPSTTHRILDLFCGRGTLALPLSTLAPVDGYEFDKSALSALEKAARSAKNTVQTYYRDLFSNPLTQSELVDFDVIVIDPPRAGAQEQCFNLANCRATTIIYISCNPETFARDAKILTNGNYNLVTVHGLDQFAWSPHVEVLSVFQKK